MVTWEQPELTSSYTHNQVALVVKSLPANAREASSIPGLRRSPAVGNSNPLQYSCLENPMDRGTWWATVHGATRVRHDWTTEQACMHTSFFCASIRILSLGLLLKDVPSTIVLSLPAPSLLPLYWIISINIKTGCNISCLKKKPSFPWACFRELLSGQLFLFPISISGHKCFLLCDGCVILLTHLLRY